MEKIINDVILRNLLSNLEKQDEIEDFKKLLQKIFIHCINLDVNQIDISEENLGEKLKLIRVLDKISIYLFSEYSNLIRKYDLDAKNKAMELTALVSDKIGDYLKHVNEEKLNSLDVGKVLLKQLKYYWKSSVAYALAGNAPNSIVIAKKLQLVLTDSKLKSSINTEKKDIYCFSSFLLNRHFISNIEEYIEHPNLISIFNNLRKYIYSGEERYVEEVFSELNWLISFSINSYETNFYWHLSYIDLVIRKIIEMSVWRNLKGIFRKEYIRQLIKSRPSVIELWPNQLEVINNEKGFLKDNSVKRTLINFPTSGGKSLLAELAIVKELECDINKKCFYIVPTNALVYEVTKRLRDRFRRLGYNVSSSVNGYEPDLVYGTFTDDHIIVTTPEKLDMVIRNNHTADILSSTSIIIFDEFQKIQDRNRGWVIEGSIAFLINHPKYSAIKLILLSAIVDNGPLVLNWINDDNNTNSDYIPESWRPTSKIKGIAKYEYKLNNFGRWIMVPEDHQFYNESYTAYFAKAKIDYLLNEEEFGIDLFNFPRYHHKERNTVIPALNKYENFIMNVAQRLKSLGGTLIFFHTREECEKFVREYNPPVLEDVIPEISYLIQYIEKRLGEDHLLVIGLKKGLVYHHGSLPIDIRESLEDFYAKGLIKIMVCTTTLVEGVNFPIQNFIHTGKKYDGMRVISSGDFKNIVGRAGRAYQSTFGQIIYISFKRNNGNIIEEHLNYENYSNNVNSSIKNMEELFIDLGELDKSAAEEINKIIIKLTENNFIKSLLLFYTSISDKEEDIENLLRKTLFSRQLEEEKLAKIYTLSKRVYSFFDSRSKAELIKIQESGLSFTSFYFLIGISEVIIDKYRESGPFTSFTQVMNKELYTNILNLPESSKYIIRRSTSTSRVIEIDDYGLLVDWIENNMTLKELSVKYFTAVDADYQMTRITEYIKDMFEFKLPWVLGTLSSLILEQIGYDSFFSYLPIFIKFGINNSIEADLFKLGFNSRETVKDISVYIQDNKRYETLDELKDYLKLIDPLEFLNDENDLLPYEVRKLVSLSNNFKEMTMFLEDGQILETYLAGTKHHLCKLANKDIILERLKLGTTLILKRELNNFFDDNAIAVYFDQTKIGYIPRKINEEVSYYLALNTKYTLKIKSLRVIDIENYIEVKLLLNFNLI